MRSPSKLLILFSLIATLYSCSEKKASFNASKYVDPQIGSVHGRLFLYTPAALPFGMAKLAPHTNVYGSQGSWAPCGYNDRHTSIEGFGHFHEFQIGGLVVMPITGALQTIPGTLENPDGGYRSRFDKETEHAEPGYYSVFLKDYGVKAELTATERVGFHRYTFPESKASRIIFDVGHRQGESSGVTEAIIRLSGKAEMEGSIETLPEYLKFCDVDKRVKTTTDFTNGIRWTTNPAAQALFVAKQECFTPLLLCSKTCIYKVKNSICMT
jgi:putative alpha-1,2-mannosidase